MLVRSLARIPHIPLRRSFLIFVLLIAASITAILAKPVYKPLAKPAILEEVIPLQLGDWVDKPSPYAQVSVDTFTQNLSDMIYDQVLMRTYENPLGDQVMVAIAFAGEQRQEIKIHQPEVCYPAQGYQMIAIKKHEFHIADYPHSVLGKQLIFKKDNRIEAVSYWIRLGDSFPMSGMEMRLKILKEGLKGNLDDGVLVRVSTIIDQEIDAPAAYRIHEQFLNDLVQGTKLKAPNLLVPH